MMVGQQADTMANPEHLARLKDGVEAWNRWRKEHPKITPDLRGVILKGAELSYTDRSFEIIGADLRQAILVKADLTKANLCAAKMSGANLSRADLSRANLAFADLSGARLHGTDLHEADLDGAHLCKADLLAAKLFAANLRGTDLSGANLREAVIWGTIFGDNDLSETTGLDAVVHWGRSTIGLDTIYRSKGKIPESFLRGCGVPDDFITHMKSLTANPIEFYSCFISYSTKDQDFADRLYADLQNKGVRCWFAPHDVQGGRTLHEQIDEAIRLHDKLLLILSPHSMESEWVKTEIAKARKREVRDQRRVLFPIRLAPFETLRDWECFDADTGKDSAREIREYFIPDFSNWKDHDSYQEAFQRLISDLKASDAKPK
jgi:uncharacterized protein YjbI with pentapeptide repeats